MYERGRIECAKGAGAPLHADPRHQSTMCRSQMPAVSAQRQREGVTEALQLVRQGMLGRGGRMPQPRSA